MKGMIPSPFLTGVAAGAVKSAQSGAEKTNVNQEMRARKQKANEDSRTRRGLRKPRKQHKKR